MTIDATSPVVLRHAAEDHLSLMGGQAVVIDESPLIDTTPQGGSWVSAWVWVPDELAAVTAQMMQENEL